MRKRSFVLRADAELDLARSKEKGPGRAEVYARDDQPGTIALAVIIPGVRWVTTLEMADATLLQSALRDALLEASGAGTGPGADPPGKLGLDPRD